MVTTVAILSIGEMGLGIAQLLQFHGYRVVTNVSDRSKATQSRTQKYNITALPDDATLVLESDYILSIVPPRDAHTIATRIKTAAAAIPTEKQKTVHFLDLNAVSPSTSRETFARFDDAANVVLYDGIISGGVPHPLPPVDGSKEITEWHCPTLLLSGPNTLPPSAHNLVRVLNIEHMSPLIGAAVGLKMCFGMLTKGYIALAIQAFTTAHRLGVREELETFLDKYKPAHLQIARDGLVRMPHTAYRWVHEMLEMAETVGEFGGFDRNLFEGVAESYRLVAEDTVLGCELPDARVRGTTVEDVVTCISEGIDRKKGAPSKEQ